MQDSFNIKQEAYIQIEAKFACIHIIRKLRKRIISDGRISYVTQCIRCGHTSTPVSAKNAKIMAKGQEIEIYDDKLSERWRAVKAIEYTETFISLKPLLKAEYEKYLKSKDWQILRKQVIIRENSICEICKKSPIEEIHHLTYIRIGKEALGDLMGVCQNCHQFIHSLRA